MTLAFLVAFAAFVLGAFFVGALAGYGGSTLCLPLLAWLLADVRAAVFVALLLGTVQAYHVILANWRNVDWRAFRSILFWSSFGVPLGFVTAAYLPERPLLLALGLVITVSGAIRLLPGAASRARRTPEAVRRGLLVAGGALQAAFAAGGAPVVLAAQQMVPAKQAFRATLFMFWLTLNTVLVAGFVIGEELHAARAWLVMLGVPFVLLANHLGDRAARKIPQGAFVVLVSALLVVAGAITVVRAL